MESKEITDDWNGFVSIKEWENDGFKNIEDELPCTNTVIYLLHKPQIAYAGHRTKWKGVFIGDNKVLIPHRFKTKFKEKPLSDFTHWKIAELDETISDI